MERFTKKHANSFFFHQNSSDFPVNPPPQTHRHGRGRFHHLSERWNFFGGLHTRSGSQNDREVWVKFWREETTFVGCNPPPGGSWSDDSRWVCFYSEKWCFFRRWSPKSINWNQYLLFLFSLRITTTYIRVFECPPIFASKLRGNFNRCIDWPPQKEYQKHIYLQTVVFFL